jgi:phenylalanyl-tRNA synthetase alpha chain
MNPSELKQSFFSEIGTVTTAKDLEGLRVKYLGRERGVLTAVLRSLKDLSPEEKRTVGPAANALRDEIESALHGKLAELQAASSLESDIDLTRPGVKITRGHLHPLTLVREEVTRIFRSLNFSIAEGPEIETEYYNFDALNVPANHPAREMWDTFWLKSNNNLQSTISDKKNSKSSIGSRKLLRTHTSPVQIRYMESHEPPFQILAPGRVFRYEATDATHETNFAQFEGLMVGKNVSIANFKYVIETFFEHFFKRKIEFRYRPSYFPFVEPGIEVDVKLGNKWLEMMGAGMVHPQVFKNVGYNPEAWQGFAFGMALERLAMVKYKIPDIRFFYAGDLRFIDQF